MTYIAYLTPEHAAWLTNQVDLRANSARVVDEGHGIVTLSDRAMNVLDRFGPDDDGSITNENGATQIWIGGDPYPVVSQGGPDDAVAVLAATTEALPYMPSQARAVTARRLAVEAKDVFAAVGDAAVAELAEGLYRRGGYAAVAALLGVGESAVNKAVFRHNTRTKRTLTTGAE